VVTVFVLTDSGTVVGIVTPLPTGRRTSCRPMTSCVVLVVQAGGSVETASLADAIATMASATDTNSVTAIRRVARLLNCCATLDRIGSSG
jgi:hypothetical protein